MKVCRLCRHYASGAKESCPRDGGELVEGPIPPVAPGDEIGAYQVGRAIAAGQSGVLLQLKPNDEGDASEEPELLLKVLNPSSDPVDARRPVLETVLDLSIDGLHPIRELLENKDRLCLVQSTVEGTSLAVALKLEGALDQDEALAVGLRLCQILGKIHEAELQHHDIRPGHLLIPKGKAPHEALLLDLGSPSPPGALSAPELHQGRGGVVGTDVYGVCLTIYVSLAGRSPFRADAPEELAWMVRNAPPPPLRVVRRERKIDPALERLIMWGLSKDPLDRPSLEKVAAALRAISDDDREKVSIELKEAPTGSLPPRPEAPPTPAPVDEAPPEVSAVAAALRKNALMADGENPTMRIVRKLIPQAMLKSTGYTQSFFVEGDEMEREVARAAAEEANAQRENIVVWLRFIIVLILIVAIAAFVTWKLVQ